MQAFCSSDPLWGLCESLIHLPVLRSHKGARLSAGDGWGAHSHGGAPGPVGPTKHEIPDYRDFKPRDAQTEHCPFPEVPS